MISTVIIVNMNSCFDKNIMIIFKEEMMKEKTKEKAKMDKIIEQR